MHPGATLYYESLDLLTPRVRRSEDAARAFALNARAAALGFPDAVLAAGWLYLNGVGVAPDLLLAERWYRRSARRGDPRAMYSLGYMAYEAQAFDTARRWFERASQAGHARSLYWLGKLAWRGHGVRRDRSAAHALFHRAARAQDPKAPVFFGSSADEPARLTRRSSERLLAGRFGPLATPFCGQ